MWSPPMSGEEISFAKSGPMPDMAMARLVAKAQIASRLGEPSSIRIEWPAQFEREHETPNDDAGVSQVNWSLTVRVTAPGEERATNWVFSFQHLALVKVEEGSSLRRYSPPLPLDDLAAQASKEGFVLEPDEEPARSSR
jgi:hypothetical protein